LDQERVTAAAAVPTIWLALLAHLKDKALPLPWMRHLIIGGAAAPRAMLETLEREFGIDVCHAWGMTELSPLGTLGSLKAGMDTLPFEEQLVIKAKQGRGLFGVEMRITDEEGRTLPRDGKTGGHLQVRGPSVASRYFKKEGSALTAEGWFDTGDIATICPEGVMQITDRAKDMIKSGGEWISSVEIETLAMCHPAVAEAAVIGVKHPKWDERPLLIVVLKSGARLDKAEILAFLEGRIAKWWMPDDVAFVSALPHTATGKVLKTALREQFRDFALPSGPAPR
jgi:fatty-acyl-CoA synthase